MNLKPLGDRVLVKPAPKEEKTSSGLYIASAAQELPQRGEVLAVGTGKLDQNGNRIALDVKVGDQVFYGKFGGTEVKVDGEELLLLRADDILAVLEDKSLAACSHVLFTCKFSYFGGILWLKILILALTLVPSLLRA